MRKEEAISAFLLLRKASHSMREPAKGGGKAKTNDSVAKGESDRNFFVIGEENENVKVALYLKKTYRYLLIRLLSKLKV